MAPVSGPSVPLSATRILGLQRQAGNRAVAGALQRVACEYEPGEKAAGIDRGILSRDVSLIAATGSGYNAAPNSIVVADFRPESAVIRTSTAEELRRGAWIRILERQSQPYALIGFTDCVGEESNNQGLRAARANAVAAILPNTARQTSVIGAAPAANYLMPGNSTRSERAMNRAVLIRLPFDELRQTGQVDEYSADAVRFWQSNKSSSVTDLITFVSDKAAALLDKNGVPRPKVSPGTMLSASTLASFSGKDWAVTLDLAKMAANSSKGVTPATKMTDLTVDGVAALSSTVYHEFRHAEQNFLAARQAAADAKGGMSAKDLAQNMGIPLTVADEAISASLTPLPDKYQAQARAWRTTMPGGRHFGYKMWNEEVGNWVEATDRIMEWDKLMKLPPGSIKLVWDKALRGLIDQLRAVSIRGDAILKDLTAAPNQDTVDADVRKNLTATNAKLFIALANSRNADKLADIDAVAKMTPDQRAQAQSDAEVWLLQLKIDLLKTAISAEEAYKAYPVEADSYQVEELVKASVKEQGSK